jgi:hypothetical protein
MEFYFRFLYPINENELVGDDAYTRLVRVYLK